MMTAAGIPARLLAERRGHANSISRSNLEAD
jgi:hypothetical protein